MLRRSVLAAAFVASATLAHAADPKVPPAQDPGLVPVALIGEGIDYTDAAISPRLARDGEGNIIGWDFVDNDIFPYGNDESSNAHAKLLLKTAGVELAPIRIASGDTRAVAGAASFASHTPARIVVVTLATPRKEDWDIFVKAAQAFPKLLFVVPAGDASPMYPAALDLDNVLSVTVPLAKDASADIAYAGADGSTATPTEAAISAAAAIATCHAAAIGESDGKTRKSIILAKLAKPRSASGVPALELCSG